MPPAPSCPPLPRASTERWAGEGPDFDLPSYFSTAPIVSLVDIALDEPGVTLRSLAAELGLARRDLQRVLGHRQVHATTADALAVALGYHPGELWADWFGAPGPHAR